MKYSVNNKPIECIMTNSTCYKKTAKNFAPKGVLWHDTGCDNNMISRYVQPYETDANYDEMMKLLGDNRYNNDWNHKDRQAGVHAFIGKLADGTVTSIQVLPLNYQPWGCGSGSKGSLNATHLQFEICRDNMASKDYFNKVYAEACELTAYYCKLYNLDPLGTFVYKGVTVPVITSHAESYDLKLGNNHGDPLKWLKKFGKTMDDVRRDVAALMGTPANNKPSTGTSNSTTKVPQKDSNEYTLKQFVRDVQEATGAKVDGVAGKETLSKTVTISNTVNNKHKVIKAVQKRLLALGYDEVGEADGVAGAKFKTALTNFQKKNGCTPTGVAEEEGRTWRKLLELVV